MLSCQAYRVWDAGIYEVVTRLRNRIAGNGEMPAGTARREVHYFKERNRESVERMFAAVSDRYAQVKTAEKTRRAILCYPLEPQRRGPIDPALLNASGNSLRVGTAIRTPA
jgi:hypothetical protein